MSESTQATAAAQADTAKTVREPGGQFAKGNKGGPGNPFARQVAALRKAILDSITLEDIGAIVNKLKEMAIAGDLGAAKLLFAYAIGKPQPAVQPDHLDVEEWEKLKATAFLMKELPRAMGPGLDLPLTVARAVRPGMTAGMGELLGQCLAEPHRTPELVSAMFPPDDEDGGYPSPNGCNRPRSPLPNGHKRPTGRGGKRRLVNGKLVPA
jgi:hypothetical protein